MKIRTARHGQSQFTGKAVVEPCLAGIVLTVIDLKPLQAGGTQFLQQRTQLLSTKFERAGVSQYRHAPCLSNHPNGIPRRKAQTFGIGGAATCQQAGKGFIFVLHMAAFDQRLRKVRTSDYFATSQGMDLVPCQIQTQSTKFVKNLPVTLNPALTKAGQILLQADMGGIQKITEHVHGTGMMFCANFNTGDTA